MEEKQVVDKKQAQQPVVAKKRFGVVIPSALNVRYAPSFDAAVAAIIKQGTKVIITSSKIRDFYAIRVNGIEGYAAKEFIEEVE